MVGYLILKHKTMVIVSLGSAVTIIIKRSVQKLSNKSKSCVDNTESKLLIDSLSPFLVCREAIYH